MKTKLILSCLVYCMITACQKDAPSSTTVPISPSSSAPSPGKLPISILETRIVQSDKGALLLKGSASNEATIEIKEARASFKLFDRNGTEVGQAIAVVNNLPPGFSWTFDVPLEGSAASTAKLDHIDIQPNQ